MAALECVSPALPSTVSSASGGSRWPPGRPSADLPAETPSRLCEWREHWGLSHQPQASVP